jgi:invasion protein IalB
MLVSLAFSAVLAASSASTETPPPAPATPSAPQPAPVAAPAKADAKEEKLVCKYEAETGSRFSKKVCMTPSQAKARRDDARKALSDIQTNAGIAP